MQTPLISHMALKRITVSLPEDVHDKLEKIAERELRTVPNFLAFLATQHVENYEKDNGPIDGEGK